MGCKGEGKVQNDGRFWLTHLGKRWTKLGRGGFGGWRYCEVTLGLLALVEDDFACGWRWCARRGYSTSKGREEGW